MIKIDFKIVVFVVFLITSMGLIAYMPEALYNSGYSGTRYSLPDEFEGWTMQPRGFAISEQLVYQGNTWYDFTEQFNTTQKFRVSWKWIINDYLVISGATSQFYDMGYFIYDLLPVVTKSLLVSNWDSENNVSYIILQDYSRTIEAYIYDSNSTRNDIELGYDAGELNCTIAVPTAYQESEYIGARDIVIALITFRLPSVFSSVNPIMAFVLSATLMIPLAFIFFAIMMWALHGE